MSNSNGRLRLVESIRVYYFRFKIINAMTKIDLTLIILSEVVSGGGKLRDSKSACFLTIIALLKYKQNILV